MSLAYVNRNIHFIFILQKKFSIDSDSRIITVLLIMEGSHRDQNDNLGLESSSVIGCSHA